MKAQQPALEHSVFCRRDEKSASTYGFFWPVLNQGIGPRSSDPGLHSFPSLRSLVVTRTMRMEAVLSRSYIQIHPVSNTRPVFFQT